MEDPSRWLLRQYPYSLDEPLLWFSNHPWRIRDALEGTAILGDTGSGKTSGSGKAIAQSPAQCRIRRPGAL